jgi:tungstate transport system substrate-binding protein
MDERLIPETLQRLALACMAAMVRFEAGASMLQRRLVLVLAATIALLSGAVAQERSITVASTTSTEQSGLFAHLLPRFTEKTGIQVKVVAVGTGQALDIGRRGDADVVLVHDSAAEERFVTEGFALRRLPVMYNDFVVVGLKSDPAKAAGKDVAAALKAIATAKAPFVSRGDRSGTHAAEQRYWRDAGVDPASTRADWYKEIG